MCPSEQNDKTSQMQSANHHTCRDYNLAGLIAEIPLSQVEKPKKYQWAHVRKSGTNPTNMAVETPWAGLQSSSKARPQSATVKLELTWWTKNIQTISIGQLTKLYKSVKAKICQNVDQQKIRKNFVDQQNVMLIFYWSTKISIWQITILLINKMSTSIFVDQQNFNLEFCWSTKFRFSILSLARGDRPPRGSARQFFGSHLNS